MPSPLLAWLTPSPAQVIVPPAQNVPLQTLHLQTPPIKPLLSNLEMLSPVFQSEVKLSPLIN